MPLDGNGAGGWPEATIQWVPDGPEVPVEVLDALEDGDLVLFCGAGISARAGLPTYKRLVEEIRAFFSDKRPELGDLIQTGQYDRAIYALEVSYGAAPVRRKVHDLLQLSSTADCSTHDALLRLATDREGKLRCVTTNFDLAFESKRSGFQIDEAPKLPIPKKERWNSLVYMHGRLSTTYDTTHDHLVLSSADFGLAYLTERWASRFVTELFRRFKVLFMGYSADDPVMRYMLDAFAADRSIGEFIAAAYAFVPAKPGLAEGVAAVWRSKGVTPILYKEDDQGHDRLHATIRHWASRHEMGLQGKAAIVYEHAHAPMVPSAQTQICWALRDATGYAARIFAGLEPPPPLQWLDHFEKAGLLESQIDDLTQSRLGLYSTSAPHFTRLSGTTTALTSWLTSHLADRGLAEWIVEHGTNLHPSFRVSIRRALIQKPQMPLSTGLRLFWSIVSSDAYANNLNLASSAHELLSQLNRGMWDSVLRHEVLFAMTPYLVLKRAWPGLTDPKPEDCLRSYAQGQIMVRADQDAAEVYRALRTHVNQEIALSCLASDAGQLLSEACELLVLSEEAGDGFDYSYIWRPSIEDHHQNLDVPPWLFLISLVRDSMLALTRTAPRQARALVDQWAQCRIPLMRRLVFFAAARTTLYTEAEILQLLLEMEPPWLWSHCVQREAFQALENVWTRLDESQATQLLDVILAGPPRTMFRPDINGNDYKELCDELIAARLALLQATRRKLPPNGEQRLNQLRPKTTPPTPEDRAYFPSWTSSSWGDPTLRRFDPAFDMRKLAFDEQVDVLAKIAPESPYWTTWRLLVRDDVAVAIHVAAALGSTNRWPIAAWKELLVNLPISDNLKPLWQELCDAITLAPNVEDLAVELAFVLRNVAKSLPIQEESCFWVLWDRIESVVLGTEEPPGGDVLFQALNTPSGALAQAFFDRLDAYQNAKPSSIPSGMWDRITALAKPDAPGSIPAQVLLAAQLARLFRLNPEWVQSYLLPLLKWDASPRAPILWQGYLWQFSMPADLWPLLRRDFLETVRRESSMNNRGVAASWLAAICIHYPEWLDSVDAVGALSAASEAGRTAAAHVIWQILSGAKEKADTLWRERVDPFLCAGWPKQTNLRSSGTSCNLALAAVQTNREFPRAVKTLQDLVVPTPKFDLVTYELQKTGSSVPEEYPRDLLHFLAVLVDTSHRWVDPSLRDVLNRIAKACPECTSVTEYHHLDEYALARGV